MTGSFFARDESFIPTDSRPLSHHCRVVCRLSGQNVYWIIPDGYSGVESLDTFYDFDNRDFLSRMAELDFAVLDGRSNAVVTHVSVAMALHMNFLPEGEEIYGDRNAFFPLMLTSRSVPPLFSILSDHGYRLFLSGNTWSGCPGATVECIGDIGGLTYASRTILEPTPLKQYLDRHIPVSVDAIGPMAANHPILMRAQPFFVLVHHLPPHPPHLVDRNCDPRAEPAERGWERDDYVDSILCVNRMLEDTARAILQEDPGAIIVIQSDHGGGKHADFDLMMADWGPEFLNERTEILNLVRAPAECRQWLQPDLGQVNMARFVLGCLAREEPRYLDETTVLTTYETSPEFGKVVHRRFAAPPR